MTTQTPTPVHAEWRNALEDLARARGDWAALSIAARIDHLRAVARNCDVHAQRWVRAACEAKGLELGAPLAGEEWSSGPWATILATNRLIDSLRAIEVTGKPRLRPGSVRTRRDGRVVVDVFPQNRWDKLLLSGVRAEVWMQPGVTEGSLPETMAVAYAGDGPPGSVALVLGAGNIAGIPALDVLYKLFVEKQVCLLKMNPVNEYLGPIFEDVFADLITAGFVRVVYGGADAGQYLVAHELVDEVHVTGSSRTHDAIVFGVGPEGEARKESGRPVIGKRVTSELGNVSPTIVVPGPWSGRDLRFQAAHIATQKMHNAGFNCIAAQVLVTQSGWGLGDRLLDEVAAVMQKAARRPAYYPGAGQRQRAQVQEHPSARLLGGDEEAPVTLIAGLDSAHGLDGCFRTEAFTNILSATSLDAAGVDDFLDRAVDFCNNTLWGTLGANIIIHPATAKRHAAALDRAIARLRYGCIGVNAWTGVGFLLPPVTWGAFPGHTPEDIQSGVGVVHNSLMFDRPEKSVVYAPFFPYPRGLLHGQASMLPVPPWFITHRRGHLVTERLTRFEADHRLARIPSILAAALRS